MIALFEPLGGASGNMLLGAVLDTGVAAGELESWLQPLGLGGWKLVTREVVKGGIRATHMDFQVAEETDHRHLTEIVGLLASSSLPEPVKALAERVFRRLGEAEARVHGIGVGEVHFHEVGATDAILDVVGFCQAVHQLDWTHIYCTPLPQGRGTIECAHGTFPNPGPATAELLRGIPVRPVDLEKEMVTPTAAALLSTLASFEVPPACRFEKIGYGAGTMDFPFSNTIRLQIGSFIG